MIRRFGAALTGLALTMPLMVVPVTAHTSGGLAVDFDTWQNGAETYVAGTVTNHTSSRVTSIQLTATFKAGTTTLSTESAAALVTNLAPHSVSPFLIVEEDTDVSTADSTTVGVTYNNTVQAPAGGIHIDEGELTADQYVGTVTNDASVAATDLVVYATRSDATGFEDAAGSVVIPTLAAGATTTYTINFDGGGDGTTIANLTAKTNSGTFLASWNNYFNDLGNSNFVNEVAYLADEGITLGCGTNRFCPADSVTREQMAAFLDRALALPTDTTDYFTDDDSSFAEQSIQNIRGAGITTGCTSSSLFCPTGKVTREQMAAFLDRAHSFPTDGTDYFVDDNSSFAEANIQDMRGAGVTTGCTDATHFCPSQNVTREQMAAFLYRTAQWAATP